MLKPEAVPKTQPKISLTTIAELLNISPATVSRVLNDRPGISEETRERVMQVVRQHGSPRLKKRRVPPTSPKLRALAFVISKDIADQMNHGSSFYERHLLSIQRAAADLGFYAVMVDVAQDINPATGNLRCVELGQVHGVIAKRLPHDLLLRIRETIPVVTMNDVSMESLQYIPETDVIIPNIGHAAQMQLEYLHSLGHRKIACFRLSHQWQDKEYWNYFRSVGTALGLYQPPSYFKQFHFGTHEDPQAADAFMEYHFSGEDRPTAIVTYDIYALSLKDECVRRKITIPKDLSILGFDDNLPQEFYRSFPLTTYRQNFEEMGREAVRALVDRLDNPHLAARRIEVAGNLVMRHSTESLAS